MNRREFLKTVGSGVALFSVAPGLTHAETARARRPNFLFIITDDQSWKHVGCYGDTAVRTPSMDALAKNGVRFANAYCAAPSCSPSRAAILTGQDIYRLEEGGILSGFIRDKFDVFPLMLQKSGYFIGNTGKPYAPRTLNVDGTHDAPVGRQYNERTLSPPEGIKQTDYAANFEFFLDQAPQTRPFFFWVGMSEPHIPHPTGLGKETGISSESIKVPSFYPDVAEIRDGLSDYLAEIEWADHMIGRIIRILEDRNLIYNTVIVFTSDNGMPFPRAKATLYEYGVHMPLIVRWEKHVGTGHVVTDPVSLTDLAPTFLELAGLEVPAMMTGKSLRNILFSTESGRLDHQREFVVSATEKHTLARPHNLGFPRRALHSENWTYIRNFEPSRYPGGHPKTIIPDWGNYGDIDPSVIKTFFMKNQDTPDVKPFFDLGFGKVPAEELYDKRNDVDMIKNLADDPSYQKRLVELRNKLEAYLTKNDDPRMKGLSPWDDYNLDKPFPVSQPKEAE